MLRGKAQLLARFFGRPMLVALVVAFFLLLPFQNCGSSESIPTNPAAAAVSATATPSPTPSNASASITPQTINPGQTIQVTINLADITQNYVLEWQITPTNTDFASTSGAINIAADQSQATFTLASTLQAGCGDKNYQIVITEPTNSIPAIQANLSLVDNTPVASVAITANSGCAVISGVVKCWGLNNDGQLGNGSTTQSLTPTQVSVLNGAMVTQVAAGGNTPATGASTATACAIQSGALYCWGNNANGQVGDGTTTNRLVPTPTTTLTSGVTQVAVGVDHSCAIQAGGLFCWGSNANGQLGTGTTTSETAPAAVSGMSTGVTWVAAGESYTCAVQSGAAKCWGLNSSGQLGNGTTAQSLAPQAVTSASTGVLQISTGTSHTCALISGAMSCWGDNTDGDLGDGTTNSREVLETEIASGVTAVSAGNLSSYAVVGNALTDFGDNLSGQLGIGSVTNEETPQSAATGLGATIFKFTSSAAGNTVCALTTTLKLYCWGNNASGQVGNGNTTNQTNPVLVSF